MTAVRLSERERATLLALDDLGAKAEGSALAAAMRAYRPASVAAAHQSANALDNKGLARKLCVKGRPVRYEITDNGRALAARVRGAL